MLGRGVPLAIGLLTLCVASSAEAQGNLDQGKTAAELYATGCAGCHKSPQSVSNTKWRLALESFLRVGFETHADRAMRRTSSITDAA
jgi:hypothetical protein